MKKLFVLALMFSGVTGFVISPWIQGQSAPPAVAKGKDIVSYRDVVKKVLPSVVSIEAKAKPMRLKDQGPKRKNQGQENPQIPEEFRKFFEEFKNEVKKAPMKAKAGLAQALLLNPMA